MSSVFPESLLATELMEGDWLRGKMNINYVNLPCRDVLLRFISADDRQFKPTCRGWLCFGWASGRSPSVRPALSSYCTSPCTHAGVCSCHSWLWPIPAAGGRWRLITTWTNIGWNRLFTNVLSHLNLTDGVLILLLSGLEEALRFIYEAS